MLLLGGRVNGLIGCLWLACINNTANQTTIKPVKGRLGSRGLFGLKQPTNYFSNLPLLKAYHPTVGW